MTKENSELIEFSRNVAVAATSLIPGIGGVLSLFLDKYLPSTVEKRRNAFLEKLSFDMEKLPSSIISKISTDEEYHSLVIKIFRAVIQEDQIIKIEAFRNILVNAALAADDEPNETEFYIKLITELTSDQMRILHLFYLRDFKEEIQFANINKYIDANWTEVDESYRFALVTELIRYGLISGSQNIRQKKGNGQHLSEFGERFIRYIFQPNEVGRGEVG